MRAKPIVWSRSRCEAAPAPCVNPLPRRLIKNHDEVEATEDEDSEAVSAGGEAELLKRAADEQENQELKKLAEEHARVRRFS